MILKNCLYFIVSSLMFSSCSNSQSRWDEIIPNGINGENLSLNYLFLNNRKAIMLGTNITDDDYLHNRFDRYKSIIYSSDDNCHTWRTQQIGIGEFTSAAVKDSSVCVAINKERLGSITEVNKDETSIYLSRNFGDTWDKISSFSKLYVRDIFYSSFHDIFLIGQKTGSSNWILLYTNDNGNNWKTIQSFPYGMTSPVFLNNNIFYFSNKSVIQYSLNDKKFTEIKLQNNNLDIHFLSTDNKYLYVCGVNRNDKTVQVQRYDPSSSSSSQFENILEIKSDKFPINLHLTIHNELVLILGERNPLAVTYSVYYKKNNGNEVIIPIPYATFEPFSYNNNLFCGYSYPDIIYCLDFSKL